MPIYEYRCNACGKRASIFFRSFSAVGEPACPDCQSQDMQRLVSKVAVLKSNEQRLEHLVDVERNGLNALNYPTDPRDVERWARTVGDRYDSELGTNFREMAEQMTGDDRPYDLYDPRGSFQAALDNRYAEMAGGGASGDMWDQYIRESGASPQTGDD